ncbi:MAG: hypothetical protein V3S17_00515, partial [candidate division Zixibacteria bacterium]
MKNSIFIIFVSIFIVGYVSAQVKVVSNAYTASPATILWPGNPRSMALGYFNIVGDGDHPHGFSNPALVTDISDYSISATTYPHRD